MFCKNILVTRFFDLAHTIFCKYYTLWKY